MSKENVSEEIKKDVTEEVTDANATTEEKPVDTENVKKRPKTFMEKAAKSVAIWRPVGKKILIWTAEAALIYGVVKVVDNFVGNKRDDSDEKEPIDGDFTVNN